MAAIPKILFFDSGMGGLSVFKETFALNPQAAYYYLFDHECFPYGNKSEIFLRNRVTALLKGLSDLIKPDLIVIACNTASTTVLVKVREVFSVPIVGVVPAIKPAAAVSNKHSIALLATPGTVARAYTDFLINEFAYDCKVLRIGTQDLVRLAENSLLNACRSHSTLRGSGWYFCDQQELTKILQPILELPPEQRPDAVVLGCTHFPLLRDQIQSILGEQITLVDSGAAIARRVQSLLQKQAQDMATNEETQKEAESVDSDEFDELDDFDDLEDPSLSQPTNSGPQVAFFTGKVNAKDFDRLTCTFDHFGFHQVRPFVLSAHNAATNS